MTEYRDTSGVPVTRSALAIYYDLRKLNLGAGNTDRIVPRFHTPIDTQEPADRIKPARLASCMREEIDIMRMSSKNRALETEALEGEVEALKNALDASRAELGEYRDTFGSLPENIDR